MSHPRLSLCFAVLASLTTAMPAYALNCTSKDTDKIKILYKAYVDSGKEPTPKIENYNHIGTSGVSLNVNGTLVGITNYESCWRDSPPCTSRAYYDKVAINFLTSTTEIKSTFGGKADNALVECFRRLGLAAQDNSNYIVDSVLHR